MEHKLTVIIILFVLLLTIPVAAAAQSTNNCGVESTKDKVAITNPLAVLGVCSPGDLVVRVIQLFSGIIGTGAVMFTVFSAFKLVIATNEEAIKSAKDSITWSVGGFAVAILSFTIVSGAAKLLGIDVGKVNLADDPAKNTIDSPLTGPVDPRFFWDVVGFVMVNILGLFGIVTIFMIIYYGYRYITAAGQEENLEQAKTGLKWALAGFVIALLSYAIISGVQRLLFFGVSS